MAKHPDYPHGFSKMVKATDWFKVLRPYIFKYFLYTTIIKTLLCASMQYLDQWRSVKNKINIWMKLYKRFWHNQKSQFTREIVLEPLSTFVFKMDFLFVQYAKIN